MRKVVMPVLLSLLVAMSFSAYAADWDATGGYICDAAVSDVWSYEGYRASDNTYLSMVFGRAPLTEVTKYGIEAHYLPDGDQPYYPFITRFPDGLWGSPATEGGRFDAVLTWTAPQASKARLTGFAKLLGNMAGESEGKKLKVVLMKGAEELWSAELKGGNSVEFDVQADVSAGDKVHMHLINLGDRSGNLTSFNLKVSTGP